MKVISRQVTTANKLTPNLTPQDEKNILHKFGQTATYLKTPSNKNNILVVGQFRRVNAGVMFQSTTLENSSNQSTKNLTCEQAR